MKKTWLDTVGREVIEAHTGAIAAVKAVVDNTIANIAALFHHIHSRTRVYPQDVTATITLAAAAVADTFGAWTQIIPINTVDFVYMCEGVVIEQVDAATTYFIQLGYSLTDGDDPTTARREAAPAGYRSNSKGYRDSSVTSCPLSG